jgi:hypothetical protein
MAETRRQFTAEQKIAILRRHLLEHSAVSKRSDEERVRSVGNQPSVFYPSSFSYVTPRARLEGLNGEIMAERRRKLAVARQTRQMVRHQPQLEEQRPILVVAL